MAQDRVSPKRAARKTRERGTGQLRKRGRVYVARYWLHDESGKPVRRVQKSLGTNNPSEARAMLRRLVAEAGGEPADPVARPVTLREVLPEVVERMTAKTRTEMGARVERYAGELLDMPLSDIQEHHVCEVIDGLRHIVSDKTKRRLEAQTIRNVWTALSVSFKGCKRMGLIKENPCRAARDLVSLPQVAITPERPRATLQWSELAAMLRWKHPGAKHHQFATVQFQAMLALATFTGLRRGEVGALRWDDFEPDLSHVRVLRQKKRGKHFETLGLHQIARTLVAEWWAIQTREYPADEPPELLFPALRAGRRGARNGHTAPRGVNLAPALRRLYRRAVGIEVWKGSTFEQVRQPTRREAQILDDGPRSRRLDFHSARRSFAQTSVAGGCSLEEIRVLLGHQSERTTQRYLASLGLVVKELPEASLPAELRAQPAPQLLAPVLASGGFPARPARFERATFGSVDRRSIQLSYGRN